jgi:dihydropteroate synthase
MGVASSAPRRTPLARPTEQEHVFGERACRLEARASLAGRIPACRGPEMQVLFAGGELRAAEREVLLGLPGMRLLGHPPGMEELRGDPELLGARLAEDDEQALEGLHCLLQAWRNATAPRPEPRVMGVVNVTPDSFSDGGRFPDPQSAVAHGLELVAQGADILDVGGESTRPGSRGVSLETELERVLPVVEELARSTEVPISVDTQKSEVARAALDAGARILNDVSAGRFDPRMIELAAERDCELVLMHMLGRPREMQERPRYADAVREILAHLRDRAAACLKAGMRAPRITVDPGIGFGKRLEDNSALIRAIPELRSLGLSVLLGVSRKSFLGMITGTERPADRIGETAAAVTTCTLLGADVLRVHDVSLLVPAVRVARALGGH